MTNSADPEPTDLDLHCLLRQSMSCSAREGLSVLQKICGGYSVICLDKSGYQVNIFLISPQKLRYSLEVPQ